MNTMKVTTPTSTTFIQYVDEDDMEEPSESDALTKNHRVKHNFQKPSTFSANIDDSKLVDDDNARRKRNSMHNDKDVVEITASIVSNRPSTFIGEVVVYDTFYDGTSSNQNAHTNEITFQQRPTDKKTRQARIATPSLFTTTSFERAADDDEGMLMEERHIFKLNVGGKSYRFRRDVILECREPDSLLSILIRADHYKRLLVVDGYAQQTGEYYLERNSKIVEYIVEYFLTGKLHKPSDICLERFREELLFWHLTNVELAPCCSILADSSRIDETLQIERELDEVECFPEFRKVIWHLMENPSSSIFSKMFSFVSIAFIFTSVLGLIMGSMPEFQVDSRFAKYYHIDVFRKSGGLTRNNAYYRQHQQTQQSLYYDDAGNTYILLEQQQQRRNMNDSAERHNRSVISSTVARQVFVSAGETLCGMLLSTGSAEVVHPTNASSTITAERSMMLKEFVYRPTDNPHHHLIVLEYVCITWFTVEFIIRFLVSPKKIRFLRRPMNLIDLFTVFPIFIEFGLSSLFGVNADQLKELTGAMLVIRILRVLRMARVFKLARYSMGLQVFGYTLRSSLRELCMLSMFLVTGTVFFSTIMYFLEKDEPGTDFGSIPAACWWCIITVTTVGYGDCLITTTLGKAVAAIASIFGIIILAFPISMVVENFAYAQEQSHVENQIREAQMAALANDYLMRRYPSRRKACQNSLGDEKNFIELMHGGRTVAAAAATHQTRKRGSSISAYHSIRLDSAVANRRANHLPAM